MITGSPSQFWMDKPQFMHHVDFSYPYMDLPELKFEVDKLSFDDRFTIRYRIDQKILDDEIYLNKTRLNIREQMAMRLVANFDKDPSLIRLDEKIFLNGEGIFIELRATIGKVNTLEYNIPIMSDSLYDYLYYEKDTDTIREYWEHII